MLPQIDKLMNANSEYVQRELYIGYRLWRAERGRRRQVPDATLTRSSSHQVFFTAFREIHPHSSSIVPIALSSTRICDSMALGKRLMSETDKTNGFGRSRSSCGLQSPTKIRTVVREFSRICLVSNHAYRNLLCIFCYFFLSIRYELSIRGSLIARWQLGTQPNFHEAEIPHSRTCLGKPAQEMNDGS